MKKFSAILPPKLKSLIKRILTININTQKQYVLPVSCQSKSLKGKVIVVIGGAGGIGRAISIRLAIDGAKVCICGRNAEALKDVAAEIIEIGGAAHPFVCDIIDSDSIRKLFSQIYSQFLSIDALVNCAGGSARSKANFFHEQHLNIIDQILNVNLRGTMLCSKQAALYMLKKGKGSIVNISSIIGMSGKSKFSDYAAAKAGIIGFTKSLAIELSPLGINVNCVSPGKITRGVMTQKSIDAQILCNYVNRSGHPEDVASIVTFLCSDEASFITGQNIVVDGGRSLGLKGD
jgi:3-oxoacyl-[acyl-carrier protein] reductase